MNKRDRLTEPVENPRVCDAEYCENAKCRSCLATKTYIKLSAYEDTGLSPYEVSRLKERLTAMTDECLKWHERAQDMAAKLVEVERENEALQAKMKEAFWSLWSRIRKASHFGDMDGKSELCLTLDDVEKIYDELAAEYGFRGKEEKEEDDE